MAKLAGMTYEAFERRFRREFDTTAYKWLLKQICQRIVGYLSNPEMTIKQPHCVPVSNLWIGSAISASAT